MSGAPDLSDEEVLALVTLARYLIRADGVVTGPERKGMLGIGRQVGLVRFSDAIEQAEDKPLDGAELLRLARLFDTQDKRVGCFRMLAELAAADGIASLEEKLLNALAATWGLEWSSS